MEIVNEKLTNIANAIRAKTGKTGNLTLDAMKTEIEGIKGLNFEVTNGTSTPANPTENMIWINSNTSIPNYFFSKKEPVNPVQGSMWFVLGTSNVKFNILTGNFLEVSPYQAKQFIDGNWVDTEAKTYQNGEWIEWWKGDLFTNGEEYITATGGWVLRNTSSKTSGTLTNTGSVLNIECQSQQCGFASTAEKIDLTDFNTLTFDAQFPSSRYGSFSAGYSEGKSWGTVSDLTERVTFSQTTIGTKRTVLTLDISDVQGEYYICIGTNNSSAGQKWGINVFEAYLS